MPPRFLRWLVLLGVFIALGTLIGAARFWVFGAILAGSALYLSVAADPTLIAERIRPGGPTIDRRALRAIRLSAAALLMVALADIGLLHWSDTVPASTRAPAMLVFAASTALAVRAVVANRFFSVAVRVQADRGHHVVTDGPYRIVRHPGYLGMIVAAPAAALALGSWLALVPAFAYSLLIARRAAVEDRYLRGHLDGYADYADRVRFRLVPGVW
jgi:protein-S-isoprenylcysteine O-methyltransferase Ste14